MLEVIAKALFPTAVFRFKCSYLEEALKSRFQGKAA
jgi:hypothetical protein